MLKVQESSSPTQHQHSLFRHSLLNARFVPIFRQQTPVLPAISDTASALQEAPNFDINPQLMVSTSVKGCQRQKRKPGIAPSLIESVVDVHESFEDMLSDFGKLQIETPDPIIEDQTCRNRFSDWRFANESWTTYQSGRDIVSRWEADEQCRIAASSTARVANLQSFSAAFDDAVEVKIQGSGRLLRTDESPGLEKSCVLAEDASQNNTSLEWENLSPPSSDRGEVIHPEGLLYSDTHSQSHESVLYLGSLEEGLPYEPPASVPGPSREMITKPDGCRFIVTGMHHLTACKPSDPSTIVNLPFGSFDIENLKPILISKLTMKVPLDCITFTGHEQYSVLSKSSPCLPSHRKSLKGSQWHVRTKMTPEDWHHVLMVCGDEDWQDFDQLWQNFLPTVTSDFVCSVCDAELPRPQHRRISQLRGDS